MCGRYAAGRGSDELVEDFEVTLEKVSEPVRSLLKSPQQPAAGAPDWNMAPSKNARVVLERESEPGRQLRLLSWGLVPGWAQGPEVGVRMINARSETLLTAPAFRAAARARRLLVPADGWYEWQLSPVALDAKGRPRKQPFFTHRSDGVPLAFAGVYEFWRDPSGDPDDPLSWLVSFAIVTGPAEPGLDRIHDRQPVVLDPDRWAAWLDPGLTDPDAVAGLLRDQPVGRFAVYPVGRAVGSARSNGPGLLAPVGADELVGVVDPTTGEVIGA